MRLMRACVFIGCLISTTLAQHVLAAPEAPAASAPAAVTAAPVQWEKGVTVEGITEYRFPNGLRVLLAPDASKSTTTVNITYLVGSRMEHYGETGMAHLLEHLVFKGTPTYRDGALVAELKKRGMNFNGSTWYDRTNYHETFAASDTNLEWALGMEADRMVNSFISRKDLDSEMTVVRNEMESGENDPGRMLWEKMGAAAYQWHNYGKSTIGARADVENVNIEHLQAFYRKYYQPDNAVLVVAGKFSPERALARIAQAFGSIAKPSRVIEPTYTVEPVQDGAREVTLARVGDSVYLGALYHISAGAHPDMAALRVLAFVLADTPSGRLHKALVEPKKAVQVDGFPAELAEPGYLAFFVQLNKAQSPEAARKVMLDVIENVKQHPITERELNRAKVALLNSFEKTLNDPSHFGVGLSESIALGDWRLFFLGRDQIEAATIADVQRVAENYLKASNRTFGEFIPTEKPDRATIPATPAIDKLVAGYTGRKAQEAGEDFDASAENIERRTQRLTLPGGMQLALLPKKTRGNTVRGQVVLRMGDEKSLFNQKTVAQLTAELLTRGAQGMSRQDIADALETLKASLAIATGDGNAVTVSFETRRDQLTSFLKLLRTILRAPSFPAPEFEQLRVETQTAIEDGRHEPQAVASRALARYDNPYPKGDVRYAPTVDEELTTLKGIKPAQLAAFHKRFYGAQFAQFALVGDFDADAAKAQIQQLFGDWKNPVPFRRVPNPYRVAKPASLSLETPDKANAFFLAGLALPLKDDTADYPALLLGNRILGGGGLKSRIADRLRQKDGISYGAGSALHPNAVEPNSPLIFYAIYAPQNLAKLKAGMAEELARLLKDGVTASELAEAKTGIAQEFALWRTRDANVAGLLAGQLQLGRDMRFEAALEARLQQVSVDEVNAALRKYVDPAKFVNVYAGDFAKAAAAPAPAPAPAEKP